MRSDTKHQKQSFKNWQQFRKLAPVDPKKAQIGLWSMHDKIKVPIYVQAGIHGNESEGIDASLQVIERLATTPYGTDPEVDTILDNAVVLFNVIHNPDGHIAESAGEREQLRPEPRLPDPVAVRDEGLGRDHAEVAAA